MINRVYIAKVSADSRIRQSGSTQGGLPLVVILVAFVILLMVNQLGSSTPWLAPNWERAHKVQIPHDRGTWGAVVDPVGWEFLQQDEWSQLLRLDSLGPESKGNLFLGTPRKRMPVTSGHEGYPRTELWISTDFLQARAELYDSPEGRRLVSGPVEAQLSGPFIGEPSDGLALDALRLFPRDTERIIWIDTTSFRLPNDHRKALRAAWKRWEFQPTEALSAAFKSPFCYAKWDGGPIFLFGLESRKKIEAEINQRFPKVVMKKTSTWAQGTQVVGFGKEKNAAWFYRGDYFVAAPSGGVEFLQKMLQTRFELPHEFQERDPMIQEFQRLANLDKRGWHVCIIESDPKKNLHWALLLRISKDGQANGYLIAELQPKSSTAKDIIR